MRYLHQSADSICAYIRSRGLRGAKCDFEKALPMSAMDVDAIRDMLERANTLWGAALPFYVLVSRTVEADPPSLDEAVSRIEASPDDERFLIVAYQDGGLITVTGKHLPFQVNARKADWWRPYRSASRSRD
jgi:hypothetical protein